MIARVNSGEMILNNRQQRNLFSLLNGNGASSATGTSSELRLKISGKDLIGVLNTNNNLNKRYK